MFKENKPHNNRMLVIIVLLVAISTLSILTNAQGLPFSEVVRDPIANVEYYVIKGPINFVKNVFIEFNDLRKVYRENEKLKSSLDDYARELALNEVLDSELAELKEITKIDSLSTDYKIKYTTIIQRDAENWSNQVIINLGSNSKIEEGMAVITSAGMIGTVTKVTAISSVVTLLTNENTTSQVPVMIMSGGKKYYGLLDNYDVNEQVYNVKLLSTVDTVKTGSKVTTSGLGGKGKSPKGILIGTVTGFSAGNSATGKTVTVKPSVDFDSLNYVAVIQRGKK
ncbi:MAG: rod shape-determining protein MreC [Erysipelotrichaceae bacterium]|nr:rod shape-determining protein MreC [Erysipelotrichaceae bacterium]